MKGGAVHKWLLDQKNWSQHPKGLQEVIRQGGWHVDHIMPHKLGGIDHPFNYFVVHGSVNSRWNMWISSSKKDYMGEANWGKFLYFLNWVKGRGRQLTLDYNDFESPAA